MSSEMRELIARWRDLAQKSDSIDLQQKGRIFRWCANDLEALLARTEAGADGADPYQEVPISYLHTLWGAGFDVIHEGGYPDNMERFAKAIEKLRTVLGGIEDPVMKNTRITNFPVFDADDGPVAALESLAGQMPYYLGMAKAGDAERKLVTHRILERIASITDQLTQPQDASGDAEVAWSVLHTGNHGAAYDPPNTRRAFTYEKQPGNIDASRLGRAADAAAVASAGDSIDRGLALLKELQAVGFGVFHLGPGAMQAKEAK